MFCYLSSFVGFPFQTLLPKAAQQLKADLLEQLNQEKQDTAQEGIEQEDQGNKTESKETLLDDQPEGESQEQGEEETEKQNDGVGEVVDHDQYFPDNQLGLWDWTPEKKSEVPTRPVSTPVRPQKPVFTESPDLQNKAYMKNRHTREALTPTEPEQDEDDEFQGTTHDDYIDLETDLETQLDQDVEDDGLREP